MFKNLVKKIAVAATALCAAFGICAASGCSSESDHPTVTITVEFDNKTYDLNYTLYRNMYPNTVRHFITLADNGFYNDMLVHDYLTADWITGLYGYDKEDYESRETGALADYFLENSREGTYMDMYRAGKLQTNVFNYSTGEMLPTLVGEFEANKSPEIENGKLTAQPGALKMIYNSKATTDKVMVDFGDGQRFSRDYKYNCATCVFSIQVADGTSYSVNSYCVFGRLDNLGTLTELKSAVSDYIQSTTITVNGVLVDNLSEIYSTKEEDKEITKSYTLPEEPIVIRSVRVTKY